MVLPIGYYCEETERGILLRNMDDNKLSYNVQLNLTGLPSSRAKKASYSD
jgi:hypothetical protein